MDTWILRVQHHLVLGLSGDSFHFQLRPPAADAYHSNPTLGTGQEEKVRPDDEEQDDVDGAGETVHSHNEKSCRRRDAFVVVC